MKALVEELSVEVGAAAACRTLGFSRATQYRKERDRPVSQAPRPSPPRTLSQEERQRALDYLHGERFVDESPGTVVATLLDEGEYVCSERTLYRILSAEAEVRERRRQARHGEYARPELLATGPNEVWSWDITKVKGPGRGVYYALYVVLDIFSRYVVGWRLEHKESDNLARDLLNTCFSRQEIVVGSLTVHADRGPSMRSKAVSDLLYDLGVMKSHSRPYTSDDNPYSESAFKTLKYRPEMPERFSSIHEARGFFRSLFAWYNLCHHHSGIAMLTPEMVHTGKAKEVLVRRQAVLDEAYNRHPERFVKGRPTVPALPESVWINQPATLPESIMETREDTEVWGADGLSALCPAVRAPYPPRSGDTTTKQR